jgi:hypothetical protein
MNPKSLGPKMLARLPKGKIRVVYGFVLGFLPDTVIAIEGNGQCRLPGGVVEGLGEPTGSTDGQHFQPLAWHVKEQTGLDLTEISNGTGVSIFEGESGPSVSVLYIAKATGSRTKGRIVSAEAIPEFDSICPVSTDQIQSFLKKATGLGKVWERLRSVFQM